MSSERQHSFIKAPKNKVSQHSTFYKQLERKKKLDWRAEVLDQQDICPFIECLVNFGALKWCMPWVETNVEEFQPVLLSIIGCFSPSELTASLDLSKQVLTQDMFVITLRWCFWERTKLCHSNKRSYLKGASIPGRWHHNLTAATLSMWHCYLLRWHSQIRVQAAHSNVVPHIWPILPAICTLVQIVTI